jgi:hypothetical protein
MGKVVGLYEDKKVKGSLDMKTVRGIAEFPPRRNLCAVCGRVLYRVNSESPELCSGCNEFECTCPPKLRL